MSNDIKETIRQNNPFNDAPTTNRVIGNFSGGLASAISCYYALEEFPNVELVFMDTSIEHPDTYKLIKAFEKLTGEEIRILTSDKFTQPEEIWRKYRGMNFATGAPCSTLLKRDVVNKIKDRHTDFGEVFGYDNIYVVDASVIPANLGVNPVMTIVGFAERAMSKIPAKTE